jgi:hypothetical protein
MFQKVSNSSGFTTNLMHFFHKCVKLVVNPELPQDARSTKYKKKKSQTVSKHQPLCYLLTHWFTPSTSSVMRTPENKEEDPDDPEPADKEDIPMDYSSD